MAEAPKGARPPSPMEELQAGMCGTEAHTVGKNMTEGRIEPSTPFQTMAAREGTSLPA